MYHYYECWSCPRHCFLRQEGEAAIETPDNLCVDRADYSAKWHEIEKEKMDE